MKKGASTKPSIRPIADKILIKPLSDEELGTKSPSGIIIPETINRERADRGTVIAVGEGKRDDNGKIIPPRVRKGDRVIFQWGDKFELNGEEYYLVGESNVLAVIE
jgi:chaperonin GroES